MASMSLGAKEAEAKAKKEAEAKAKKEVCDVTAIAA